MPRSTQKQGPQCRAVLAQSSSSWASSRSSSSMMVPIEGRSSSPLKRGLSGSEPNPYRGGASRDLNSSVTFCHQAFGRSDLRFFRQGWRPVRSSRCPASFFLVDFRHFFSSQEFRPARSNRETNCQLSLNQSPAVLKTEERRFFRIEREMASARS